VKLWTPGCVSYEGEVAAYNGGAYQALRDTAQVPGGTDWIILAAAGVNGKSFQIKETYDPEVQYSAFDVVAREGGSFVARKDNPGPCPGENWQLMSRQGARGIAGPKGERGEKGEKGDPGVSGRSSAPAPTLKSWKLDRQHYVAIPIMSDGSEGPALELRALFEED
jgi:hypothetical protein